MLSTAKIRVAVRTAGSRALRNLRLGGALIVIPAILPRFGEPSAILVADITCPQSSRTVVATTPRGQPSATASVHSPSQWTDARAERTSPRAARPSLSVRLRALWENRGRTLPALDRVQTATPPATR